MTNSNYTNIFINKIINIFKETKKLTISSIILIAIYVSSYYPIHNGEYIQPITILASILIHYIILLSTMERILIVRSKEFWLILIFYIFILMYLALCFTPLVQKLSDGFSEGESTIKSSFDSFYYCIITLTSVGYGDIHPKSEIAKIISIFISITGNLHMVVFITLLFGKLPKSNSENTNSVNNIEEHRKENLES